MQEDVVTNGLENIERMNERILTKHLYKASCKEDLGGKLVSADQSELTAIKLRTCCRKARSRRSKRCLSGGRELSFISDYNDIFVRICMIEF